MGDEIQNAPQQDDLLEKLLAGAAKKAAQEETAKLEAKGAVTRADFSVALGSFKDELLDEVKKAIEAATPKAPEGEPEGAETVAKAGAGRKGTVPTDPREDNPVKYLVAKARSKDEQGNPVELDTTDKAIAWALTVKGLTQGMVSAVGSEDNEDEE